MLRSRGGPLGRAAARVCREAGAAVATHVLVRDLNVVPSRPAERLIEVIAKGLPLWGGVQLAVDTTQASPPTAAGMPRRDRGITAGAALRVARARPRTRTWQPMSPGCPRHLRLGGGGRPLSSSDCSPDLGLALLPLPHGQRSRLRSPCDGPRCLPSPLPDPLRQPSLVATCCHCQRRWRGFPPERSPRRLRRTTPHRLA